MKRRYKSKRPIFRRSRKKKSVKSNPTSKPVLNKSGGFQPRSVFELIRSRAVDLVTLPTDISGTNCRNCLHWRNKGDAGFCNHVLIQMPVTERMCCAAWDRRGTLRPSKVVSK